jgi:hypothetical protein
LRRALITVRGPTHSHNVEMSDAPNEKSNSTSLIMPISHPSAYSTRVERVPSWSAS